MFDKLIPIFFIFVRRYFYFPLFCEHEIQLLCESQHIHLDSTAFGRLYTPGGRIWTLSLSRQCWGLRYLVPNSSWSVSCMRKLVFTMPFLTRDRRCFWRKLNWPVKRAVLLCAATIGSLEILQKGCILLHEADKSTKLWKQGNWMIGMTQEGVLWTAYQLKACPCLRNREACFASYSKLAKT